ncbi:MAG: bifunctional 2-C-methyl-D-erythritol 4-phosphate cytidylyltransferase/2-C-methyl-D-erythritol 2,4-cyclodiphosphate synthase, partial [Pseudomonadota bacterium]
MSKKIIALIVAAGESKRVGGDIPKQYQMLGEKIVLLRSIEAFLNHPQISAVRVVINQTHRDLYDANILNNNILPPVIGGKTRQESERLGLESLLDLSPDYVLIHDAARPNVSPELIDRTIAGLEQCEAIIPALPVFDTLKHVEDGNIVGTIERTKLFRAQTPQAFVYNTILSAHQKSIDFEYTDDSMVAENAGIEVKIVAGSEHNYKITTREDMQDAELLLQARYETRVGLGFDAHRLVKPEHNNNKITLCGVEIAFDFALEGHSDADVALHAIVDAILGAIGEGDIGIHFPPSDPHLRGVSSSRFLIHAYNLLRQKGGQLVNIDLTIICERPRISKYSEKMIANIAKIIDISLDRINIKATTTEKMGFTGRGEGIAAQA